MLLLYCTISSPSKQMEVWVISKTIDFQFIKLLFSSPFSVSNVLTYTHVVVIHSRKICFACYSKIYWIVVLKLIEHHNTVSDLKLGKLHVCNFPGLLILAQHISRKKHCIQSCEARRVSCMMETCVTCTIRYCLSKLTIRYFSYSI